MTIALSEEAKLLLKRMVESLAWRQIAAIDTLGHCLKFVADLETKLRVAGELDLSLRLFRDVRELYAELGWQELDALVREHAGRIPYPETRVEFGLAYHVMGRAEATAMAAYVDSASKPLAAIARSYVEAATERPEPTRFVDFCADLANRPQAQQYLTRWLGIALTSFGRPGTSHDARAVELGLRSRTASELVRELLGALAPLVDRCGLAFPDLGDLGIEFADGPGA